MNEAEMALYKLAQEQGGKNREDERYEAACAIVQSGFLNAYDVLRLIDGQIGPRDDAGRRARQMVRDRGLALMELGDGRYIITHNVTIPVMSDD